MTESLLFEHQRQAAEYIAGTPRAYLGDTPGLGKTRSVLYGLELAGSKRVVVICPAIVRSHWRDEWEALERGQMLHFEIQVYSYEQIVRGGEELLTELAGWGDTLVVDEAHYCKNTQAKRTRLIMGKDGYAGKFDRVVLASGTPMPRNPAELFPQLINLRPDVLVRHGVGKLHQWAKEFCIFRTSFVRGRQVRKVVGMRNEEKLREIVSECMLRRTLADVGLDVPPVQWQTIRLNSEISLNILDYDVAARLSEALGDGESLAEIASDPETSRLRKKLGIHKARAAGEFIGSSMDGSDEKVVVFAYHRDVLALLKEELRNLGVCYVDGDVSQRDRDEAIRIFQTDPRSRVFLGQITACQTGITLTAASRAVIVEPDWQDTVNVQAAHRVARIGQEAEHCIVQMLCLAGTIDEAVVGQCAREARMKSQLFSEGGA